MGENSHFCSQNVLGGRFAPKGTWNQVFPQGLLETLRKKSQNEFSQPRIAWECRGGRYYAEGLGLGALGDWDTQGAQGPQGPGGPEPLGDRGPWGPRPGGLGKGMEGEHQSQQYGSRMELWGA